MHMKVYGSRHPLEVLDLPALELGAGKISAPPPCIPYPVTATSNGVPTSSLALLRLILHITSEICTKQGN